MLSTHNRVFWIAPFIVCMCLFGGCATTGYVEEEPELNANVVIPAWAPPYDDIHCVRYYYLPDIEVYYDVWNQEFVYLQDGSWMFTRSLLPMYAGFDLYDCFVVVLNCRVYEPWMHYHYYVSHYPRYYYHSVYNVTDAHDVRGFNENKGSAIRLTPEEKMRLGAASKNRSEHEKVSPIAQEQGKVESTRPPQRMKYYGEDIGKPVKVERQMMKQRGNIQRTR
jgi:hypothetical protein